ncbi:MAG: hypothetical protein DSM106950_04210 [Stigonema ocellatum SAG 48.90 = DSM 106950]|nr:hypothetical protein [Stigonema ocellatum SAG 48.90 = DSM 106950]
MCIFHMLLVAIAASRRLISCTYTLEGSGYTNKACQLLLKKPILRFIDKNVCLLK